MNAESLARAKAWLLGVEPRTRSPAFNRLCRPGSSGAGSWSPSTSPKRNSRRPHDPRGCTAREGMAAIDWSQYKTASRG